mmetsp:Transcript_5182/g.4752  ORF Transcript_5182/g.4752 Transcript_5182/m.4752 type:complete len:104 (+) Transcript_5182:736-1047(+)
MLHRACFHGNMEMIKYLIDSMGARTDVTNKNGDNTLMVAVRVKNEEVVRYLCETQLTPAGNLDIDYEDTRTGLTAFARAAFEGSTEIADILMNVGKANPGLIL